MSQIIDNVFAEVCLDERVEDGIFKMENENHMNALRDYFVKKGIAQEAAIHVTNRMVEGKFPERQAYRREDGILVTWPSPKHMAKAFKENPGKYIKNNPNPKPKEDEPSKEPIKREPPEDKEPEDDGDSSKSGGRGEPNIFGGPEGKKVSQGDKELEVEPPRGEELPASIPAPSSPTPEAIPRTPERVGAEKEVVKQIMNTDDTTLSNINPPSGLINTHGLNENLLKHQLNEMYKKCNEWGFREAEKFLTRYVDL